MSVPRRPANPPPTTKVPRFKPFFRHPEPRVCTYCEWPYSYPCDGKSKSCMNRVYTDQAIAAGDNRGRR